MKKIQKYRKCQEIVNNQFPLLINRGYLLSAGWPSLLHATVLYCSKFLSCLPKVIHSPYNLVPHRRPCVLCRYYSVTDFIFTSDPCHVKFIVKFDFPSSDVRSILQSPLVFSSYSSNHWTGIGLFKKILWHKILSRVFFSPWKKNNFLFFFLFFSFFFVF